MGEELALGAVVVLDVDELLGVAQALLLDGAADVVLDKVLVR